MSGTRSALEHDRALARPALPHGAGRHHPGQQRSIVQALGGLARRVAVPRPDGPTPPSDSVRWPRQNSILPVEGQLLPATTLRPPSSSCSARMTRARMSACPTSSAARTIGGRFYRPDDHEYRFNITRWVQGCHRTAPTRTRASCVISGSNGVSVNRVILAGPEHPIDPMRLRLNFHTY